jgi:hypothetical protein
MVSLSLPLHARCSTGVAPAWMGISMHQLAHCSARQSGMLCSQKHCVHEVPESRGTHKGAQRQGLCIPAPKTRTTTGYPGTRHVRKCMACAAHAGPLMLLEGFAHVVITLHGMP